MKRVFFFIACMVVIVANGHAQQPITFDHHCLLANDSLIMEVVDYTDPGLPGEGRIWDFSHVAFKSNYECRYMTSSDSLSLLSADNERNCTYYQTNDSLLLLREENSHYYINYRQPLLVLSYPMHYGDVSQQTFDGDGVYCGRIFLRRTGTTLIEADGQGTLIRAAGDTLYNVLRVHSITTASLRQQPDSLANDVDMSQQEVTEHYKWFAQGLRHPAYETRTTICYYDGDPYAIGQTARRYLVWPLEGESGDDTNQRQQWSADIFTFALANNQNNVVIDYELKEPVRLQFIVTDIMGMLKHSSAFLSETGSHQYFIDCSSLRPGQYIVYMNVGGAIYNSKFTKQ